MYSTRKSFVSFASAVVLMLLAAVTQAATRNVPSQYPQLQDAINAAAPGDTIVVAAGTYLQYYSINWVGKNLTIKGAGPGKTILDSNLYDHYTDHRLYTQNLTSASRIEGFTFKHGHQGMFNENSSLTVANCEFTENLGDGAGMWNNHGSNPLIINCTFYRNVATSDGGGMFNQQSSPTVINCVFDDNHAGRSGGGMANYIDSSPTVTNCTFRNNVAWDGGGVDNTTYSSPTVTNCLFSNNTAENRGGGMQNYHYCRPTVTNCTFAQNSALAVFNPRRGGVTDGLGGAIYGVTTAGDGDNTATVTNCIIWNNTAGGGSPAIYGPASVTFSDVQGLPNATPDAYGNFAADPLFVDALNGNLRLQPASPCRDRGNNAVLSSPPFLSVLGGVLIDLDTCRRVSSARVDLGAYEFQSLTDVSAQIKVVRPASYIDSTGVITATFVLTNIGGTNLNGPISLILSGLTGATLSNKTGVTSALTPAGRPYINLVGNLPSGASLTIKLKLAKSGTGSVQYSYQFYDGIGTR